MHHVLAYGASVDASGGDVQLVAAADDIFQRANSNFQFPSEHYVIAAHAGGATLTRARLRAGSFQNKGLPQIFPFDAAVLPVNFARLMDMRYWPLRLRAEEELRVDVTQSGVGAQNHSVIVWITETLPVFNVNIRDLRWLRFTVSVTAVAFGWSAGVAITLQDNLESGRYSIYGMATQGANIIASRLLLQNQRFRPGCLGFATLGNHPPEQFEGGLGIWGTFNTYSLPSLSTFETTAGASSVVGWLLCGKDTIG